MTEQDETLLIDSNEFLKSGIHIGTKFKTKYMAPFIYKTRPDGLSVLNLQKINDRIKLAVNFLSQYEPGDILICSRRENGYKSLKKLNELTGMKVIIGRYPPGILTNTNLETFIEPKIILVCDPWTDKNAVDEIRNAECRKIDVELFPSSKTPCQKAEEKVASLRSLQYTRGSIPPPSKELSWTCSCCVISRTR